MLLEHHEFADYTGDTMNRDTFQRHLLLAENYVDRRTYGRLKKHWDTLTDEEKESAKYAISKTVQWLDASETEDERIKSETVGPHSVTYERSKRANGLYIDDVIRTALAGTGLLYRGFGRWRL